MTTFITLAHGSAQAPIRRNYMLTSHRKDELIEWMKEMLNHSFALDAKDTYIGTMLFFEELVKEHLENSTGSRLRQLVPTISKFHTKLPLQSAFRIYDNKYSISQRHCIPPSFNEIRHILNLAQIIEIGSNLKFISFDGDQTLYSDGGNFDASNDELALAIIRLLCHNVKVAVITAAGYGQDNTKYEHRIQGLLQRFIDENMTADQIRNFLVLGGECNYLFHAELQTVVVSKDETTGVETTVSKARLRFMPPEEWQADCFPGPKPAFWNKEEIKKLLDIAETTMNRAMTEMKLRARILRKERAVGLFPGGSEMMKKVPVGHGSKKLKQEALDEVVLRILEAIRSQEVPVNLPFCVFNGGTDAWLDIGNKSVGVAALQAYFNLQPAECLHVGDQVSLCIIYNLLY